MSNHQRNDNRRTIMTCHSAEPRQPDTIVCDEAGRRRHVLNDVYGNEN